MLSIVKYKVITMFLPGLLAMPKTGKITNRESNDIK